jgi:hypothetical protein
VTEQHVDWAEVHRRGRRLQVFSVLPFVVGLAALVGLTGRWLLWEGTAAWIAVGLFVLAVLLLQVITWTVTRRHARYAEAVRIPYAVRHGVDPGPAVRTRADSYARRMAGNGWLVWLLPFPPLGLLLQGQWDRPLVAVPSAVVLVGFFVALIVWWRRMSAAARRWVSDPPGPARSQEPPRWERWVTGRGLVRILIALVTVGTIAVLVAVALEN